jgi:hypothetical protein
VSPYTTPPVLPLATAVVKYGKPVCTSPFASIGALHLYQPATSSHSRGLHRAPSVKPGTKMAFAWISECTSFSEGSVRPWSAIAALDRSIIGAKPH